MKRFLLCRLCSLIVQLQVQKTNETVSEESDGLLGATTTTLRFTESSAPLVLLMHPHAAAMNYSLGKKEKGKCKEKKLAK